MAAFGSAFSYLLAGMAVLLVATTCQAKVWERCELARELLNKYHLPREQLDSWMCIAYRESRYNSTWINPFNTDGSKDYGLFQINNRWWCTNKESPQPNQNLCNIGCETVLNNMDATVKCIKFMRLHSRNTFQPWISYPYCQKEDMTHFTKDCNLGNDNQKQNNQKRNNQKQKNQKQKRPKHQNKPKKQSKKDKRHH